MHIRGRERYASHVLLGVSDREDRVKQIYEPGKGENEILTFSGKN